MNQCTTGQTGFNTIFNSIGKAPMFAETAFIKQPEAIGYLMLGQEVSEMRSGREVSQWCDDSEGKTFNIWSHKRSSVLDWPKPAATEATHEQLQGTVWKVR